jgi:hypothetical protein
MVLHDMAGLPVTVDLVDGSTFSAIFHTVSATSALAFTYVFKASRQGTGGANGGGDGGPRGYTTRLIPAADVAMMTIASMALKESQPGARGGFATDGETSGGASSHLMNRGLAEVDSAWLDGDLEEASTMQDDGKVWDQFEANFKITGRRATCVLSGAHDDYLA